MKVTLNGLQLSGGKHIPYFKLPITYAKVKEISMDGIVVFDNSGYTGAKMLEPFRSMFIQILRRGFSDANPGAVLGSKSGVYHLMKGGKASAEQTITVTAGVLFETPISAETGYKYIKNSGSITMKGTNGRSWVNFTGFNTTGADFITGVYPFFRDNDKVTTGSNIAAFPSVYVETSDGYFGELDLMIFANAVGWQNLGMGSFTSPIGPAPGGIATLRDYDTFEIETIFDTSAVPENEEYQLARYNPRSATNGIGIYSLHRDESINFLNQLWNTSAAEVFKSLFTQQASDALLGMYWFYGLRDSVELADSYSKIHIGKFIYNDGPTAEIVKSEFVVFDFGSINVPALNGNFLDYTGTSYKMYLPFLGMIDLDPNDVVGKSLYLRYHVNMTDGSAVIQLSTTAGGPNSDGLIFTGTCQWAYEIPVVARQSASLGVGMLRSAAKVATLGLGNFDGDANFSAGALNPNTNIMADFEAKLFIYRQEDLSANDLAASSGLATNTSGLMSEFTGYVEVDYAYNAAGVLPARRIGEIVDLLKEGVYL